MLVLINGLHHPPFLFLIHGALLELLQQVLEMGALLLRRDKNAIICGNHHGILHTGDHDRDIQFVDGMSVLVLVGHDDSTMCVGRHFVGQRVPGSQILPHADKRHCFQIFCRFQHFIVETSLGKLAIGVKQCMIGGRSIIALQLFQDQSDPEAEDATVPKRAFLD